MKILYLFILFVLLFHISYGQTGSAAEPVRYVGGEAIDPNVHEGRLRYAIGVENRQTFRANHTHPELADGFGWTYSHAANLAYWKGKFYQQYLSNPADEHISPGQTLMTTSADGRHWTRPEVTFPPYTPPAGVEIPEGYEGYMMHQRMGFYVAPNGRLLTLAFYGHSEDPFEKGGIGRVVREIYENGSLGPIYFIRYSSHASWNQSNTGYPFYTQSADTGFVTACAALLQDKLITLQWWDEDHGLDGFYKVDSAGEALSYYHRNDGKVVALWKWSLAALSADEGKTFSEPVKVPTLVMDGGKVWGQRTDDGRYAITYNPIDNSEYRYPLVIITSDDGIIYDHMLLVQGEVPPRRFFGRWKDFGPCYMRGIAEGNGNPPGTDMWLSYSMNKEDIWISRIPMPVQYQVTGTIQDTFNAMEEGGNITDWNIYAPLWAPVSVTAFPDTRNKSLKLEDSDPYDYARAIRVFEEGNRLSVQMKVHPAQSENGILEIDITDRYGNRPVQIRFDTNGQLKARDGSREVVLQTYEPGKWYELEVDINATLAGNYELSVNGKKVLEQAALAVAVKSVERISFRTGLYRDLPNRRTPNEEPEPPLPGADDRVPTAVFYVDEVAAIVKK